MLGVAPGQSNPVVSAIGKIFLWVWALLSLLPLVFMVCTSLKASGTAKILPPKWVFDPTLAHYASVLSGGFARLLLNSVVVTVAATCLTILLAVPAAYALSLKSFKPRHAMSSWILSTYMFPPIVAVIPIFIFAGKLGLIDSYPALIIPYAGSNLPIAVWILRSSVLQIPSEIQESAVIDGAGRFVMLTRIILPLLVPAIATAAILTALLSWNEFLFALTLTRSFAKTAPVGIQEFTGMYGTQWGPLTAAATVIVAPILMVTLVLRRRIVSGLTFGAIK